MNDESKPYTVIPNEQMGNVIHQYFGPYFMTFEQSSFALMSKWAGDAYKGGMWELRRYPNGAIAMVFPDTAEKHPVYGPNQTADATLEAISLAVNLAVINGISQAVYLNKQDNTRYHDLYFALKDSISGLMRFIVNEDCTIRTATEEDLVVHERMGNLKHPESRVIFAINN